MKKTLVLATAFALALSGLSAAPASAGPSLQEAKWGSTPVQAGQAAYGKACATLNATARAKGADGSNLVCKVETEGTYKGKRIWAYAKYPVLRELNFKLGAGPTSGYAGFANEVALALKAEKLVTGNITNESVIGGSGAAALNAHLLQDRGKAGKAMVTGYAMLLGVYNNKNSARVSDAVPVARLMAEWEAIAVPANSPYKTMKDLMAALKKDPTIAIAGGSAQTLDHFTIIQVFQAAGLDSDKLNYVPHSGGGGEVVTSMLSGATTVGVSGLIDFKKFEESGDLRILAISAPTKQRGLNYETFKSQGVNVVAQNWRGIMLPPGTSTANRNLVIRTMDVMRAGKTWQDAVVRNIWGDNFIVGDTWSRFLKIEEKKVITLSQKLGL
jgi:putative tricarboxylic transport membrane protein